MTDQTAPRALVGPVADFWLIGGASIVTLFAFCILGTDWFLGNGFSARANRWAYYGGYVVNFPHFAYSYMLFYPGFFKRLLAAETAVVNKLRLGISGLLVPFLMVGYFVFAWRTQDHTKYLGWSVQAMYFFVGWHYVKQGYGVLITMSVYKGIFYDGWEKFILRANAYAVWIYSWTRTNSANSSQTFYDVNYMTAAFPHWLVEGLFIAGCITTVLTACMLFNRWLFDEGEFSFSAVMGYTAAIYLWTLWPYLNGSFFIFVAFFHSLQYLPFVYKFKKSEFVQSPPVPEGGFLKTRRGRVFGILGFAITGVVLGYLFFDGAPNYMDQKLLIPGEDRMFFIISFILFINIHHYFLDNAFWRRDNKDVQKYLFRA